MQNKDTNPFSLEKQFKEWARVVLSEMELTPKDTQWIESKRSWYSGALSMLGLMNDISVAVKDDNDTGAILIEMLYQEIRSFFDAVKAGKA